MALIKKHILTALLLGALSTAPTSALSDKLEAADAYAPSQGWTFEDSKRWYELSQGSRLIKQSWLDALFDGDNFAFAKNQRLAKYGYIYRNGKADLPLGFTLEEDGEGESWVGMNCSACHTSQLKTPNGEVLIHGGQSMADFQLFIGDLVSAVSETTSNAARFEQFAQAVTSQPDSKSLRDELQAWLKLRNRIESAEPKDHRWGRGRADAVGVILAKTSAVVSPESTTPLPASNAPVSFPFVWNTNQQALLQHNGVVSNGADYGLFKVTKLGALIRNWTEVLGVFGHVEMNPIDHSVSSSINLENLLELEQILAKLKSPRWPAAFGKIDPEKSERGKKLYAANCASCHAVLDPDDLETSIQLKSELKEGSKAPFLLMQPIVDITVTSKMQAAKAARSEALIGTDPLMACNSTLHTIETGYLKGQPKEVSVTGGGDAVYGDYAITTDVLTTLINKEVKPRLGELGKAYLKDQTEGAIDLVRSFVREKLVAGYSGSSYDQTKAGTPLQQFLASCADQTVLAHLRNSQLPLPSYKARPLNGIWATAPYLHNGSVPTLDDLLKPQSKRPAQYGYLDGTFDVTKVGLMDRTGEKGATILHVYDASGLQILGNWNGGHEYGTDLDESQRLDLIEFLKGL